MRSLVNQCGSKMRKKLHLVGVPSKSNCVNQEIKKGWSFCDNTSWQSLAHTQFGTQDTSRIGAMSEEQPFFSHSDTIIPIYHSYIHISMLWFVFLTSRYCCIAIVLRDLSLGTVWSLSLPLWIQSHNLAVYWKCTALYNKLFHSLKALRLKLLSF